MAGFKSSSLTSFIKNVSVILLNGARLWRFVPYSNQEKAQVPYNRGVSTAVTALLNVYAMELIYVEIGSEKLTNV